jgi:hypothetical protein
VFLRSREIQVVVYGWHRSTLPNLEACGCSRAPFHRVDEDQPTLLFVVALGVNGEYEEVLM